VSAAGDVNGCWGTSLTMCSPTLAGLSLTSSSPTRSPTTTPRAPRPSPSLGPLTVRPSLPVFPTTPSESGPSYNSLRPRGAKNDETVYDGAERGGKGCAIWDARTTRLFFFWKRCWPGSLSLRCVSFSRTEDEIMCYVARDVMSASRLGVRDVVIESG
jgi:hypothetical protein